VRTESGRATIRQAGPRNWGFPDGNYLGHISVENTRLYLTANGVLLEQAAVRFADLTSALDEVLS
jgi:hypothetical protein